MIQRQLVDKLALKILEGEFGEGDLVRIDAADGGLVFAEEQERSRTDVATYVVQATWERHHHVAEIRSRALK